MAAYRQVYDSRHLQADCQEPASAPETYARQSSMGYLYLFYCGNSSTQLENGSICTWRRGYYRHSGLVEVF